MPVSRWCRCRGVKSSMKCPRFCSVCVGGKIWYMPGKFGQDVKDRVVRLVADRILVEDMSLQVACQAVAPKLGVSWLYCMLVDAPGSP